MIQHGRLLVYSTASSWQASKQKSASHLGLGGAGAVGEIGETGGRPSPSQEPVLAALLLAQAFSLGGGAGITFSGSLEELEEGG